MSFSVNSGVSGPLQSIPPAASCSHTQCAWQYQSRQLPGCWSRSTVIRPSGTSTSTVGLVSANGNATYSASLSSVAGLVIRFAMSIHGSSSYSVTTVATLVQPSSLRSTMSRAPIPGSRSRRADTSSARLTLRAGAARPGRGGGGGARGGRSAPGGAGGRGGAVGPAPRGAPGPAGGVEGGGARAPAPAPAKAGADPGGGGGGWGGGRGCGAVREP